MIPIILASSVALLATCGAFFASIPAVVVSCKVVSVVGAIWAGYSTFKKIQTVIRVAKLAKAGADAIKAKVDEKKK